MTKVVIDSSGNGLRLTALAYQWMTTRHAARRKGKPDSSSILNFCMKTSSGDYVVNRHNKSLRDDPDLVSLIETLGKDAYPQGCELTVIDVPEGIEWKIIEVAGFECVWTPKRTYPSKDNE